MKGGHVMRAALLTMTALAATAVALLLGPAGQGWAESGSGESAVSTIGRLEAEGFTVNIDRVGSAPLSQCVVTNVRNPQEQTRLVPLNNGRGRHRFIEVVVSRSISVSLDCSSR
jgi:hypothetical protein